MSNSKQKILNKISVVYVQRVDVLKKHLAKITKGIIHPFKLKAIDPYIKRAEDVKMIDDACEQVHNRLSAEEADRNYPPFHSDYLISHVNCTINDNIVGWLSITRRFGGLECDSEEYFICLEVLPEYRGLGIPELLLKRALIDLDPVDDKENLYWYTGEMNDSSQRCATRLGFVFSEKFICEQLD